VITLVCAVSLNLALPGLLTNAQQVSTVSGGAAEELKEECPLSVDGFIVELQQEEPSRRWWAAECLGKMNDQRAVEPLVRAIFKEDIPRLRIVETSALKKLDDSRTENLLLAGLKNKQTKAHAIDALGRLQSKQAVEPLLTLVQNDSDQFIRSITMDALAEIKDPRALEPLCALLNSRNQVTRRGAAMALGFFGDPAAAGPLITALKDRDDGVRWNAAASLGKLGSVEAVDPLVAVLKDSEEGVRVAAVDSLASIGDARAVEPVVIALTSGTQRVRWHAALALAKFNTPNAQVALDNALRHGELDVVAAAYNYFLTRKDSDSVAALTAAMNEHGWYAMADALRESGDSRLADAAQQWELRHELQLREQQY
jgi:HEAT repeat protein